MDEMISMISNGERVLYRAIKGSRVHDTDSTAIDCIDNLRKWNECGYEIYWMVNGSSGYQSAHVTDYRCVWIDIDAGRGDDGEYLSTYEVDVRKYDMINAIESYRCEPSAVVETRNGLHVYWMIESCDYAMWDRTMRFLQSHFSSDENAMKPCQLLRVPGYDWCKSEDRYRVKLMTMSDGYRYDPIELMAATNINPSTIVSKPVKMGSVGEVESATAEVRSVGSNFASIREGRVDLPGISKEEVTVANTHELYDYLSSRNLLTFLGFNRSSFRCPFHSDKKPSGSIWRSKTPQPQDQHNHYMLTCHGECARSWNIVSLTQRIKKCGRLDAIKYLQDVYSVRMASETEWTLAQKQLIRSNIEYLLSNAMEQEYPELHKRVSRYVPLLITILNHAEMCVQDGHRTPDDGIVWFGSYSYYQQLSGISTSSRLCDRINLLCLVELLSKLDDSQIPTHLIDESEKHKPTETSDRINYWSVSSYDDTLLSRANAMSVELSKHNFTMAGMSRELIIRTWGSEVADRVYPQRVGVELSKYADKYADKCAEIAGRQIGKNGYTTEQNILRTMRVNDRNPQRLKRLLDEMLVSYGWKRVKLTRDLKESLNATESYNTYVIIPA